MDAGWPAFAASGTGHTLPTFDLDTGPFASGAAPGAAPASGTVTASAIASADVDNETQPGGGGPSPFAALPQTFLVDVWGSIATVGPAVSAHAPPLQPQPLGPDAKYLRASSSLTSGGSFAEQPSHGRQGSGGGAVACAAAAAEAEAAAPAAAAAAASAATLASVGLPPDQGASMTLSGLQLAGSLAARSAGSAPAALLIQQQLAGPGQLHQAYSLPAGGLYPHQLPPSAPGSDTPRQHPALQLATKPVAGEHQAAAEQYWRLLQQSQSVVQLQQCLEPQQVPLFGQSLRHQQHQNLYHYQHQQQQQQQQHQQQQQQQQLQLQLLQLQALQRQSSCQHAAASHPSPWHAAPLSHGNSLLHAAASATTPRPIPQQPLQHQHHQQRQHHQQQVASSAESALPSGSALSVAEAARPPGEGMSPPSLGSAPSSGPLPPSSGAGARSRHAQHLPAGWVPAAARSQQHHFGQQTVLTREPDAGVVEIVKCVRHGCFHLFLCSDSWHVEQRARSGLTCLARKREAPHQRPSSAMPLACRQARMRATHRGHANPHPP
jgi:hypothetical protein